MAGFQGIRWASTQLRYDLTTRETTVEAGDAMVPAVSRSIHYGLCLAFEGIRFRCRTVGGQLVFTFFNLHCNVARFRRSIRFNLAEEDHHVVPTAEEMESLFVRYLSLPENRDLFMDMARTGQQGYLRPFTVDEQQSIGVTFPKKPCLRVVGAGYDGYLGEPFSGVVVPDLVRATACNGTGCLKLGANYMISVKAVQEARKIEPTAIAALMLDDRPHLPVRDRNITEWDTSCALFALSDGSFVKIPESPLILPSVTIQGIVGILRMQGHTVAEREMTYGELEQRGNDGEIVTVASIGTAGILNRCTELHLFDGRDPGRILRARADHPAYEALGEARKTYWDIYAYAAEPPAGMVVRDFPAVD